MKLYVAVELNELQISIVMSPVNEHDSRKFIYVIKFILNFLDDKMIQKIILIYADKGYDAKYIQNYLRMMELCFACHTRVILNSLYQKI